MLVKSDYINYEKGNDKRNGKDCEYKKYEIESDGKYITKDRKGRKRIKVNQ